MNTDTGEILPMEEVEKLAPEQQAKFKEIPPQYQHLMEGMNRTQRRKWYKRNKHLWEVKKVVKDFKRIHKEDTSYATEVEAKEKAIKVLNSCEGFMLFTVQKDGGNQLKYAGNAFIQQDHAAGMPVFIQQVLNGRKSEIDGDKQT